MVHDDPVAQVDRVSVSEAGGHEFDSHRDHIKKINIAKVAKLVDAQASGVCTARREGSSPSFRTIQNRQSIDCFFCVQIMVNSIKRSKNE